LVAITPEQSKAARALLGLTQADLAERIGVSARTIVNWESHARDPIPVTIAAIQRGLEQAGIIFLDEDRKGGRGVRLLAARRRKR
jgi:transcriptional regulator with XRE-family HTH domain